MGFWTCCFAPSPAFCHGKPGLSVATTPDTSVCPNVLSTKKTHCHTGDSGAKSRNRVPNLALSKACKLVELLSTQLLEQTTPLLYLRSSLALICASCSSAFASLYLLPREDETYGFALLKRTRHHRTFAVELSNLLNSNSAAEKLTHSGADCLVWRSNGQGADVKESCYFTSSAGHKVIVAVPITSQDKMTGVLMLGFDDAEEPLDTDAWVTCLKIIAGTFASVLSQPALTTLLSLANKYATACQHTSKLQPASADASLSRQGTQTLSDSSSAPLQHVRGLLQRSHTALSSNSNGSDNDADSLVLPAPLSASKPAHKLAHAPAGADSLKVTAINTIHVHSATRNSNWAAQSTLHSVDQVTSHMLRALPQLTALQLPKMGPQSLAHSSPSKQYRHGWAWYRLALMDQSRNYITLLEEDTESSVTNDQMSGSFGPSLSGQHSSVMLPPLTQNSCLHPALPQLDVEVSRVVLPIQDTVAHTGCSSPVIVRDVQRLLTQTVRVHHDIHVRQANKPVDSVVAVPLKYKGKSYGALMAMCSGPCDLELLCAHLTDAANVLGPIMLKAIMAAHDYQDIRDPVAALEALLYPEQVAHTDKTVPVDVTSGSESLISPQLMSLIPLDGTKEEFHTGLPPFNLTQTPAPFVKAPTSCGSTSGGSFRALSSSSMPAPLERQRRKSMVVAPCMARVLRERAASQHNLAVARRNGQVGASRAEAGSFRKDEKPRSLSLSLPSSSNLTGTLVTELTSQLNLRKMSSCLDRAASTDPGSCKGDSIMDLKLLRVIGKGGFATVFQATWRGLVVAAKLARNDEGDSKLSVKHAHEIALLNSLSHPGIIQAYSCITDVPLEDVLLHCIPEGRVGPKCTAAVLAMMSDTCTMCHVQILELCEMGSITAKMMHAGTTKDSFSSTLSTSTLYAACSPTISLRSLTLTLIELASSLAYLHKMGVVHCDLKPANVLVRAAMGDRHRGFTVKLADFGLSRLNDDAYAQQSPDHSGFCVNSCGTTPYVAPEALQEGQKVNSAVDVYSFGIIMWELYTGLPLYRNADPVVVVNKVLTRGMRPAFPSSTPTPYRELAECCWAQQPCRRPLFSQVVDRLHALLKMLDTKAIPETCDPSFAPLEQLYQYTVISN